MSVEPGVVASPTAADPGVVREPDIGERVGPYQLVARLGDGGSGDVFRARDARLGRDVAVKILRDRFASAVSRARFQREARAVAMLSHPHVVTIYDVGAHGGVPYLVTELLVGETLRTRLARGRPALAQAVAWAGEIARGLAAAHARGIVHRDLKPANLFVVTGGAIKILDFGLARAPGGDPGDDVAPASVLSRPGEILGTAGYLAPEQARGEPVTPAADLFSLGAVLFELLTGARAFAGAGPLEQLDAVLAHEPPPPSSLRPEVPATLDRLVARCLAKDPARRFESARDLEFALGQALTGPVRPRRGRRGRIALTAVAALALVAAGAAAALLVVRPAGGAGPTAPPVGPMRSFPLTHAGRDRHPSASPDGRFLAFTSDRDGRARIWLQQLDVGRETALTDGVDSAPRFSPDGNQILFTREQGASSALYRVGLLGGDVRKVVDDASDGDWSPDGREVAFVRARVEAGRVEPVVMIARVDGSGERELYRLSDRVSRGRGVEQRVRWSPDGASIAISGYLPLPGMRQQVMLIPVAGGPARVLAPPSPIGLVSAVAWDGPGSIVYSQAQSVSGNSAGSAARIVRQRLRDGAITTLAWTSESSFVVDRWPGRGLVYDVRSARTNLRMVDRAGGGSRTLSQGTSTDRQPRLAPGGGRLAFTSNRGGNLDVWVLDRATGASQRLTEHVGEDWDPAFTADGRSLLWSSNRSGNFEIWMAEADGSSPRQVTRDGVDAENPCPTPDGQWIVFSSNAPGRAGIWRVRPDGSEASRVVADGILPEVSPDGRHVLFVVNRGPRRSAIAVARLADGVVLPFTIDVPTRASGQAVLGRARWLPDGQAIAFVGQDDAGRTGVFAQAFVPDGDTAATRVALAGFDPDRSTESFDVDGAAVILAESDRRSDVMGATDVPAR